MLKYFDVIPYMVFDGDNLPSKSGTELERHTRRQESKALGLELQRKGRTAEAYQELQKAVDVTPYMARLLIEELKKMDVQYVVAPYEADAQLAYLEREAIINGIISEDSDLLVFGAKRLITKLDQHGDCIEINRADFAACRAVSLIGWTDADFRRMCILSGCDYLPNIPRLGLKTAYRCIRKYKNVERALRMVQFEGQFQVPSDYFQKFKQAELTFLHQRVFCPRAGRLVALTQPGDDVKLEELTFIGDDMDPETAVGVASGDLDPTTKEPIVLKPLVPHNVASIERRQTLGSSAELKPNKPISSFFTPRRVPLAELDPNSLTPSPSQQRLLSSNANRSWEASPAPLRPSAVRSAPPMTSNRISPMVRSADRTSFLAQAARRSTFQPSKRPRLCSEAEESSPSRADSRSRFFSGTADNNSPIGQKVMRSKKPRKSTLDVFSDELAEDIMTQIPDPAKKSHVDEPCKDDKDEDEQKVKEARSQDECAQSKSEEHSATKRVPESSVSLESNPKIFNQILDYHIERQNSALHAKFSLQPKGSNEHAHNGSSGKAPAPNDHRLKTTSSTPNLQPVRQNSVGAQVSGRQRLTPLQRLGQSALSRSQSLNVLSAKPTESTHVGQHGSEDLIIPDSEEDEAGVDEEKPRPQPLAPLDLKRFTFTA